MKFYLSAVPTPSPSDESLFVKVYNISRKTRQRKSENRLSETPDEKHVEELNDLASKPPFCYVYKVKKYDPL